MPGLRMVDQVAEDVQFARPLAPSSTEEISTAGTTVHAELRRSPASAAGTPVDRVVVGERHQLHPASGGVCTTPAGSSSPSEYVECDCRSKLPLGLRAVHVRESLYVGDGARAC